MQFWIRCLLLILSRLFKALFRMFFTSQTFEVSVVEPETQDPIDSPTTVTIELPSPRTRSRRLQLKHPPES
jgi:hypothetical protein